MPILLEQADKAVDTFDDAVRWKHAPYNDPVIDRVLPETEVVLYQLQEKVPSSAGGEGTTGDLLAEMGV